MKKNIILIVILLFTTVLSVFATEIAFIGGNFYYVYNKKLRSDYKTTYDVDIRGNEDFEATLISDCATDKIGILELKQKGYYKNIIDKSNLQAEKMVLMPKHSNIAIFHNYVCRIQKGPRTTSSKVINGGNINWDPYLKEMEASLYRNPTTMYTRYYQIPDPLPIIVIYRVSNSGTILSSKLIQSAGGNYLTEDGWATKGAINAKLNPLPKAYTRPYVDIEFHYDHIYNAKYYDPTDNKSQDEEN